MNKRRRIVADRLKALTQGGFMQALRNYPTKHKLDIDRIEYETPDFISTHATPQFLAEALDRNFQGLDFMDGVKYPELVAPELETTVPVLAVKSRATDVNTLARDTVAAVKQELVKTANLFAQLHIMNHEKTGEWPEWYQERYDAALRKVICWEREWAERVDHFAGFPEELSREDKCDLFLGRMLAAVGKADELEALRREKGWSVEEMSGLLMEVEAKKQQETASGQSQKKQGASHRLYDKLQPTLAGGTYTAKEDMSGKPENTLKNSDEPPQKISIEGFMKIYAQNQDLLNYEFQEAVKDSYPQGGLPREQGGFVLQDPATGKVSVMRLPGGKPYELGADYVSMKFPKNIPENAIATFHTHPMLTKREHIVKRKPEASPEDIDMSREMGIPGIVLNPYGASAFDKDSGK